MRCLRKWPAACIQACELSTSSVARARAARPSPRLPALQTSYAPSWPRAQSCSPLPSVATSRSGSRHQRHGCFHILCSSPNFYLQVLSFIWLPRRQIDAGNLNALQPSTCDSQVFSVLLPQGDENEKSAGLDSPGPRKRPRLEFGDSSVVPSFLSLPDRERGKRASTPSHPETPQLQAARSDKPSHRAEAPPPAGISAPLSVGSAPKVGLAPGSMHLAIGGDAHPANSNSSSRISSGEILISSEQHDPLGADQQAVLADTATGPARPSAPHSPDSRTSAQKPPLPKAVNAKGKFTTSGHQSLIPGLADGKNGQPLLKAQVCAGGRVHCSGQGFSMGSQCVARVSQALLVRLAHKYCLSIVWSGSLPKCNLAKLTANSKLIERPRRTFHHMQMEFADFVSARPLNCSCCSTTIMVLYKPQRLADCTISFQSSATAAIALCIRLAPMQVGISSLARIGQLKHNLPFIRAQIVLEWARASYQ